MKAVGGPTADIEMMRSNRAIKRRQLLRAGVFGGAGLSLAALVGCGGDDKADSSSAAEDTSPTAASSATTTGQFVQDPALPFPFEFPEPASTPKDGGVLVYGSKYDTGPVDPALTSAGGSYQIYGGVYDRLMRFRQGPEADSTKAEIEPELAESWEISPDGLTFAFKVRPGVKWQNIAPLNGRPLTADDVKFAYDRYATDGIVVQNFEGVQSIEVTGSDTIAITLKSPLADFLIPLAERHMVIFPRELVDNGTIKQVAVGTGPMLHKETQASQRVILEKNPDYWRTTHLDGVETRIIPDASARTAAYRSGQIDMGSTLVTSFREVELLLDTNPDIQIAMNRVLYASYMFGLNNSNPKFADVRIRRALSMSMDRAAISKIVFDGYSKTLSNIPWTLTGTEEPTVDQLGPYMQYDPAEAKKLLQAATGQDDFIINSINYPYQPSLTQEGATLVDQWRNIGVDLQDRQVDYNAFSAAWQQRKLPEATTTGWFSAAPSADAFTYAQLHSQSARNWNQINDPKLDDLTERQRVELDPEVRRGLLKEIYDYEIDQMHRIPYTAPYSYEPYNPHVHGVRFDGALGSAGSTYDWITQIHMAWLDK